MATTDFNIGTMIVEMRRARGLTREALAEAAGIAPSVLKKVEKGGSARLTTFKSIAKALGVSLTLANPDGSKIQGAPPPLDPNTDALSALLEIAIDRNPALQVRPIRSLQELEVLWHIDNRAYGNANVTFESFQSWWLAYPHGLQAILQDDEVLGAVGIWPVPEGWQRDFWAGRSNEEELTAEMITQAGQGQRTYWYISGVVLDASRQRTGAIASLLRKAALAWGHEANISQPMTVTAMAISEHGERLLNRFGFSLVNHRAKDGFPIYTRTVAPRDLPLMLG